MMQSETLPILESPLKKPKLDAEESSPNPALIGISSEDDGGLGHIKDKNLIEEYLKYERQVNESEGFDVDFVPRAFRRIFGSHIFPCKLDDPKEMEFIQECTDFAIAQYNRLMKSKSHLQLVKIVKANKRGSYNHACFITFEALNTVSNKSATYQARVFCGHGRDYKELLFIRRKDQMKDIFFPVDLKDKEEYKRIKKCIDYGLYENRDMLDEILKSQLMQLQLTRIVNAVQNTTDHRIYRIVFEAMDVRTRQTDTYFAEANYASRVENDLVGMPYMWRKGQENRKFIYIHITILCLGRLRNSLVFHYCSQECSLVVGSSHSVTYIFWLSNALHVLCRGINSFFFSLSKLCVGFEKMNTMVNLRKRIGDAWKMEFCDICKSVLNL